MSKYTIDNIPINYIIQSLIFTLSLDVVFVWKSLLFYVNISLSSYFIFFIQFNLPVEINWNYMDDQLLTKFWELH